MTVEMGGRRALVEAEEAVRCLRCSARFFCQHIIRAPRRREVPHVFHTCLCIDTLPSLQRDLVDCFLLLHGTGRKR